MRRELDAERRRWSYRVVQRLVAEVKKRRLLYAVARKLAPSGSRVAPSPMSVLVTGGAGYIGSHTVRALRDAGCEVVVLDTLEYGHREAVLDAALVVGDVADTELVRRVVGEHDVDEVVHFAGYKAAGESMLMPERYFDNNVTRTSRFLHAIREAGVTRIVFSSSCSVYGTPRSLPVAEDHPTGPESPYGESKLMVEQMLRWFAACHGVRSVALRYFNAAGASADARLGEDSPTPLNLVPVAMQAALGQIPALPVYGTDYPTPDGSAIRDYVHVDDLADAHVRALRYLENGGDTTVVNVGTGQGIFGARGRRRHEAGQRHRLRDAAAAAPSRAIRARCTPTIAVPARCSNGSRSTGSTTSSPARGRGTPPIPPATGRRPPPEPSGVVAGVLLPGPAVGHPPCARRRSRVECEWWAQCGCWRGARSGDAGAARWCSRCWSEWSAPWCSRRPPGPAAAAPPCHGSTRFSRSADVSFLPGGLSYTPTPAEMNAVRHTPGVAAVGEVRFFAVDAKGLPERHGNGRGRRRQ